MTREALKRDHPSPWGGLFDWQDGRAHRGVAGLAVDEGATARPSRRRPARSPARPARTRVGTSGSSARDATTRPTPSPPRSTRSRRSAAGSARPRARTSAVAASSTSRSRSGRSSASPRSTARLPAVEPPAVKRTEKVGIVGGGPAGMSAAYYLARLGYPVTVFEAMPVPGGMMAIGIPSYRLPRDVLQAEIARIVSLGVDLGSIPRWVATSRSATSRRRATARSSCATGASKSRRLGVPGDDAHRAWSRPRSSSSGSISARSRA